MAKNSKIEWTDATWNPVVGCSKISPGCDNCYAERMACRLAQNPKAPSQYQDVVGVTCKAWNGRTALVEAMLEQPLRWRTPRRIFVGSMTDLFHRETPDEWLDKIFAVVAMASRHTFVFLTKRPEGMRTYLTGRGVRNRIMEAKDRIQFGDRGVTDIEDGTKWPLPNVWLGVTAENQAMADYRIPILLDTPAAHRFVSVEPMLGPMDVRQWLGTHNCDLCYGPRFFVEDCEEDELEMPICPHCGRAGGVGTWDSWLGRDHDGPEFDWAICGGETGPHARPMHPDWVRGLRDQCAEAGVPFFFKSWGEWAPCSAIGDDEPPMAPWGEIGDDGIFDAGEDGVFACRNGVHHEQTFRVGKRAAGRLLNGVEHNAFPCEKDG